MPKRRNPAVVGVEVLRRELARLEKRVRKLERRPKRIGFRVEEQCEGDRIDQDTDDPDVPDEVP